MIINAFLSPSLEMILFLTIISDIDYESPLPFLDMFACTSWPIGMWTVDEPTIYVR